MSAQLNQTGYVASPTSFDSTERRVGDVEQLMLTLHKNTDELYKAIEMLEQRLSCVLPPSVAGNAVQQKPEAVRVPLANQLTDRCASIAGSISRLNDIIARVDLPQ